MVPLVVVVPVVMLVLVRRARRRAAARGRDRVRAALAPTIDLIVVVLGSGGTVFEAVSAVAELGPSPVRPAFSAVLQRSGEGVLLSDALAGVYGALTPDFHPLLGTLSSAERDGGAVSLVLQRLSDDAEQARASQLEASVKRLSVSLLVPLVVCLLPAVVVGALVPLVLVAVGRLGS